MKPFWEIKYLHIVKKILTLYGTPNALLRLLRIQTLYSAASIDWVVVEPTICSYCYCYTFHDPYIYIYIYGCVCVSCECFGNIMQHGILMGATVSFLHEESLLYQVNCTVYWLTSKMFMTANHLPHSQVRWIQSIPFQPTSKRSILISSSHLCLGVQHGIYFYLFPDQFHHWPLGSGQQTLAQFTIQTHVLVVRHKRHWAKQCHCNAVFAVIFSVKNTPLSLVTTIVTDLLFDIY